MTVALLAGCTGAGGAAEVDPPSAAQEADGDAGGASADVITVEGPDPDDVIADGTFTVPGSRDDQVRVGIQRLAVEGDVMNLRLVLTPLYDNDGSAVSVFQMFDQTIGIVLIDRENLKEYRAVHWTAGTWSTDAVHAKAFEGESVGYQTWFAAPVDDIDTIDVQLHASWPVFEDVPIVRED
ncbi:hypothetical protein DNL40_08505 [Xylanimonas oleitrophica]|uniref:Uncharacterized protein n=1 Tax=Xylanimonas oleitrophica TaxID=2607479 RepID=A0A2W5WQC6_9MICO|nr:hypothetical protein DNL40_08505 [Xylanimonas oleitrophica]